MSMGDLSLLLICVVVAWPERGWRADPVARRVRELLWTPTSHNTHKNKPCHGSTIEPSLLAKVRVSQPKSCKHGRALPTSHLSYGIIGREMMPLHLPINA